MRGRRDPDLRQRAGRLDPDVAARARQLPRLTEGLRHLAELARTVGSSLDVQAAFAAVADGALELLRGTVARLWLLEPATGDTRGATTFLTESGHPYLEKPFQPAELAQKLHELGL